MGAAKTRKTHQRPKLRVNHTKTGEPRYVLPPEAEWMAPLGTSLIFEDATQLATSPRGTATILAGDNQGPTFAITLHESWRTEIEEQHRTKCGRCENGHAPCDTFVLILRESSCHPAAPLAIGLTRNDENRLTLVARCDECGEVLIAHRLTPATVEEIIDFHAERNPNVSAAVN